MLDIKKYDIVYAGLDPIIGSEQGGVRPCLVLQNNIANSLAPTILVASFTGTIKKLPHSFIVEPTTLNGLTKTSRVDLLQIRTIDKKRITHKIGVLDPQYKIHLKQALYAAFDFNDIL